MNKTIILVLASTFTVAAGHGQKAPTYLNILNQLSIKLNLDLSYSPDLAALSDTTCFNFSLNPDSCIKELQNQTKLKISKTETHLIVSSKLAAYIQLQGKLVDSESGEPLPYANILVEKAGTGTVTNTQGEFDFKILGRLAGTEVSFSFLGYEQQHLTIPESDNNSLCIKMCPKPYTLADIYVLPNGNEAVDIVKRAVKNIKRNYDRNTHQLEAFYRRTDYRDSVASQLVEAALLIEDKGITTSDETVRIQIQEIRKSTNYLVVMSKKHQTALAVMEKYFGGHLNILYRTFTNQVRDYQSDWWYKPLTDYEKFNYEFEGFEWLDSTKVYKIRFIYNTRWPDGTRASGNKNLEAGGYIYINSNDWAILKVESWWRFLNQERWFKDNYLTWNETGYQKINGKYYLKYKRSLDAPDGEFWVYENPDAPDKNKRIKSIQNAESIMLITNVVTSKNEMNKIRYREKLARDENSLKTAYPYNPAFWKIYNGLKENPVEEKFIHDMEWEKSLEIQFEERSSNDAQN